MNRKHLAAVPALIGLGWFGWRHWHQLAHPGHVNNTTWIAVAAFLWLAVMMTLAQIHRDVPQPRSRPQRAALRALKVTAVIPVYNEDPAMFAAMLNSLSAQTRPPQKVYVIDDGSATDDCKRVFDNWYVNTKPVQMDAYYQWKTNAGKREAQALAFHADPHADIYMTIDSDVHLDPHAVEYGLLPFSRRRTMSVCGMLVGANHRSSLLTRLVELGFVSSFLNGRAQYSTLGSVTVNTGGLAFYRGHIVQDNLNHYLTQTVMGRKVSSGDDAMMTRYALLAGRTVFQQCSLGYTLHPTGIRHLTNQRVRWWRSFFWGNIWMIRNFPMNRIAWWIITWQFITFIWMAMVMPVVLVIEPATTGRFNSGFFTIMMLLSYIQNTKYLSMKRADDTTGHRLLMFALSPLCSMLNLYLGFVLQFAGLATVAKTGWSTRATVEVALDA